MTTWISRSLTLLFLGIFPGFGTSAEIPGFRKSAWFEEQVKETCFKEDIRVLVQAPWNFDPDLPTQIVVFATPNGNTIEQTLGCAKGPGVDWQFDIQHVSAQIRRFREIHPGENVILVCLEAQGLSWPAWKRSHKEATTIIHRAMKEICAWIPGDQKQLVLSGHSGGGSFLFGYLDGMETIPTEVSRFIFLDANYSYSGESGHGDKLLAWVKGDPKNRLIVIAYDDREITLNGKKVIGPDGGTFRATERMFTGLSKNTPFVDSILGPFRIRSALQNQIQLIIHPNPENKILHTALVGEMNGLLYGLNPEQSKADWGHLGGPRAYEKWIQPAPAIPMRKPGSRGGKEIIEAIGKSKPVNREEEVAREILNGNIPDYLRSFQKVSWKDHGKSGKEYQVTIEVMSDYLGVGSEGDFVRLPLTPQTVSRIADSFGCSLPTRKMVDQIYSQSTEKLAPSPMTERREEPATFLEHHRIIEKQREPGLKRGLIAGIKKDIVISNRLEEKANRVAIYGWHQLDGKPIQPLNVSHVKSYVDYSHGIRLVKRFVLIDGKPRDIRQILMSSELAPLLSDEGVIRQFTY